MRIALVAPLVAPIRDPQLGGAQTVVADLAAGLAARGHEIDVYAAGGSLIEGARFVDTGVDSSRLAADRFRPDGGTANSAAGTEAAFRCVYATVRERAYDVVHNHAFDAAAVRLAAGSAPAVIHTLHLPPSPEMARVIDAARAAGAGTRVVAVSELQAAGWRRLLSIDEVIRNGVPTDRIPYSELGGTDAVFAGRLSPEKGAAEAIEIARAAGMSLDVYGDAYDPSYARERIEPLGREPGIGLHAAIRRSELWRRMGEAAAVLCPVLWDEPFGLSAAEAQATGTPVIAFRRGGLAEVVLDGITGFLVKPGDLVAAARALASVGGISRAACRHHAEATLDLEPMLEAHERLYAGAPAGSGG